MSFRQFTRQKVASMLLEYEGYLFQSVRQLTQRLACFWLFQAITLFFKG